MAELARRVLRPIGFIGAALPMLAWAALLVIVTGFVFYTAWVAWTSPVIQ